MKVLSLSVGFYWFICRLVSLFNMILMWLTVDCKALNKQFTWGSKLLLVKTCDAVPVQTGTVGPAGSCGLKWAKESSCPSSPGICSSYTHACQGIWYHKARTLMAPYLPSRLISLSFCSSWFQQGHIAWNLLRSILLLLLALRWLEGIWW